MVCVGAFTPMPLHTQTNRVKLAATIEVAPHSSVYENDATEMKATTTPPLTVAPKPIATSSNKETAKKTSAHHQQGIFSPIVRLAKYVLGEKQLNELRAKAISLHSDTIKQFVSTAESDVGAKVLELLFQVTDQNHNGTIEEEELKLALEKLGFKWLKEKQVHSIFSRAGGEEKGYLTLEEWMAEAPKTLKTNLVKLAKTNGGDLGFLV